MIIGNSLALSTRRDRNVLPISCVYDSRGISVPIGYSRELTHNHLWRLRMFFEFIFLLIVAAICGSIGRTIAGYSHGGCLVSVALGFIGALLGRWIADILGLPLVFTLRIGGRSFPIIWSIIGAALFVALISLISGRRGK